MLQFDAYQRYETVKQLLKWALPDDGASILDVGGYPARMRSVLPEHRWVVCDPLVDAAGDQVQGSAWELPFLDNSFDVSVSLDVLEHIAPENRIPVLNEMARVSRTGVIVSFPQGTDAVVQSESAVREAFETWHGKPHPWLDEHAQFDLPDTHRLMEHLNSMGGNTKAFPVGALQRWTQLQLLSVLMEAIPNSLDFAAEIDALYENELFAHEFQEPSYRVVILHQFDETLPLSVEMIEPNAEQESLAEIHLHTVVTRTLLTLQQRAQYEAESSPGVDESPLQQSYIEALERGVRSWEDTYTHALQEVRDAHRWRDAVEQRLDFRIYRKLMRLFGARFPE